MKVSVSPRRALWAGAALTLLYNLLFILFLLARPGNASFVRAVDDVANGVGPLLILPWCLGPFWSSRPNLKEDGARWALLLLGLGPATFVIGQAFWTYGELFQHHLTPFPSWADAGYLAFYPVLLLGIVLLPARRLSLPTRVRVVMDGLMTMVAIGIFSWYFVLGPTVLQSQETVLAKVVAAAYPLGDVALVLSLLLLWIRVHGSSLRYAVALLSAGMAILVGVNGIYDFQLLHGAYATGELIDPGWSLGYMLVGLGVYALHLRMRAERAQRAALQSDGAATSTTMDAAPLWWSLLPYVLIPGVGLLAVYARPLPGHIGLRTGVYIGSLTLVALILCRQILMVGENTRLYRRLNAAFTVQGEDLARRVAELEWLRKREQGERARLEALLQSSHALNSTLDDNQILWELAHHLVTALGASNAAFTYIDLEARTCRSLVHYAVAGSAPLFGDDPWESLDEYPELESVLRTRRPFMGHVDDPAFPANERAYLLRHGLQSELMVPLIVRDQSSGVLEIHWDRRVEIGPETVALCTAIAEQAAVALENARLYADAATRADCDALTGLLNHRALLAALDHALLASPTTPCALLLLDVDNFKLFNDTYGHAVGDAVLLRVAGALRAACRAGDVAGRYGGDEFALLLRGVSAEEAQAVAARVRGAVAEQPYVSEGGSVIPLTVSVGVARAPGDGLRRPEVLAVADAAMYAAKRTARRPSTPLLMGRVRDAADLLGDSPFGVLEGLVAAVDAKDRYTCEHSEHVTALALRLAEALGLGAEERRALALAGPLHDVGKIAIPDRILRKPGALSADEYRALQQHVTYGVAIVRGVLDDTPVVEAIAYHHERWDGRGYPSGIAGPQTPLTGRIMQVADAVSAMLLDRPYRQGLPWERVVEELRAGAGSQFDPTLVEPFIAAAAPLAYPMAS